MATKSILKTVHVKSPLAARKLASALENAKKKASKEVRLSKGCSEASRDEIKKMFEGRK